MRAPWVLALLLPVVVSCTTNSSPEADESEAVTSGPVVIDFDHPSPPGKPGDTIGQFQGIAFGGAWRWRHAIGHDATNSIYFASGSASEASFSFVGAARVFEGLTVFTTDGSSGQVSISDDNGRTLGSAVNGTLLRLNTGWTQPSSRITVAFMSPHPLPSSPLGVDDLSSVAALAIDTTSLPKGAVGTPYMSQVDASGGTTPYTWSLVKGKLPPGLALGPKSGLINGTPMVAGSYQFTVEVTDSASPPQTATAALGITIETQLRVTTSSLPVGVENVSYSAQLNASGGDPKSYSWSASGLPLGLTIDPLSGLISGTPKVGSTTPYQVHVTVADGIQQASTVLLLTIELPLVITTGALPSGMEGVTYAPVGLGATGGAGPLTWSASGLPSGLGVSGAQILGTITAESLPNAGVAFTYQVVLTVKDSVQQASSPPIPLLVSPADFFIAPPPAGSDSNNGLYAQPTGGANGPFASINGAQAAIAALVPSRSTTVTAYVRGGTYFLSAPIAPARPAPQPRQSSTLPSRTTLLRS
jgi:hypothetical protein